VSRSRQVHFADSLLDGNIHFDYKMKPGVVPGSNALALMHALGLPVGEG
jgi:DNA mismatch repair ATPase MutS